jgi:tetratricopeptide (TPR) repeat protein
LVAANREAFLPDLARAINSLANLQGNMGQRAEALASIEEAVRHYCELAAAHPEAFLPYLATSHGAWGQILQDAGDAAAASEKFAEGVRMMTPLAQQLPQAHFELTLRLASAYEKACEEADLLPDPEITWPLEVMRQLQEEQNKPESE